VKEGAFRLDWTFVPQQEAAGDDCLGETFQEKYGRKRATKALLTKNWVDEDEPKKMERG